MRFIIKVVGVSFIMCHFLIGNNILYLKKKLYKSLYISNVIFCEDIFSANILTAMLNTF